MKNELKWQNTLYNYVHQNLSQHQKFINDKIPLHQNYIYIILLAFYSML